MPQLKSLLSLLTKYDYLALAIFILFIYLPLGAISAQISDSGELATATITGGLIHPPGYPLYWLISKLLLLIFPYNSFSVLSCLSAFCQMSAVVVLYCLLRNKNVTRYLAVSVAIAVAFFSTSVKSASDVEVFGLHHLLFILIIAECFVGKRAVILGLLSGLAAANHHTSIILAPLVFTALIRDNTKVTLQQLGVALLSMLPGLSLYLLLFIPKFETLTYFGPIQNWSDWFQHIIRFAYGTFSIHSNGADSTELVSYLVHFLRFVFLEIPFVFFLPILILFLGKKKDFTFYGWITSVLLAILFLGQLKFSDQTYLQNIEIVGRFFTFPVLLLLSGVWFIKNSRLNLALIFLLLIPVGVNFQHNYQAANAREDLSAVAEVEQVFATVPPGSIYLSLTDRESFGLLYAQMIQRQRPDLIVLINGLNNAQYLNLIKKRFPIFKDIAVDRPLTLEALYGIARQNQLEIFTSKNSILPDGLNTQSWGNLYKWKLATQSEDRNLTIESIAMACSNFPRILESIPSERQASWVVIRSKFINPLVRAIEVAQGERKISLQHAYEAALKMDFKTMREYCLKQ